MNQVILMFPYMKLYFPKLFHSVTVISCQYHWF